MPDIVQLHETKVDLLWSQPDNRVFGEPHHKFRDMFHRHDTPKRRGGVEDETPGGELTPASDDDPGFRKDEDHLVPFQAEFRSVDGEIDPAFRTEYETADLPCESKIRVSTARRTQRPDVRSRIRCDAYWLMP